MKIDSRASAPPHGVEPPERAAVALIASLVLHVVLLLAIALIWDRVPRGTGEDPNRPIGIALVHRLPDRDRFVDASEAVTRRSETEQEATPSQTSAAAPPADLSPPLDLAGILETMQSAPAPTSGTGLAGQTELAADAFAAGRGKSPSSDSAQTTTMVFGVSGSGSRFVYVFDRSDSMNGFGGKPLRAAKRELIRSLRSLTDRQRFQLIFYNDKPTPLRMTGVPLQMMTGEESNLVSAERYINSIAAFGATQHESAIKLALRMSPDVIFFLTDARIPRLSDFQLREIQIRAQASGTTIHAIEFGSDASAPRDSFLRELAAMNQGQYQYVHIGRM